MPHNLDAKSTQSQLEALNDALNDGTFAPVRRMLNTLTGPDIAHLIESAPPKQRAVLWKLLAIEREGEVLQELNEDIQADLVRGMETDELLSVLEGLEPDDIADILQQLPNRIIHEVLQAMDTQDRHRVERILPYDEDSAGGLMNTDTVTVRPSLTLDVVLRYLRRHDEIPEMTDSIFVVNRSDHFLGALSINKLLVSDPNLTVREVMDTGVEPIPADMPDTQVAILFERHDWVSAPVVDTDNSLLGRITIDDVVDVIREDADHSLMSLAGLDEDEDTFATVRKTAPRRAIWLGVNLIAVFISANVIGMFEQTIEKLVALAILMPIVASMGGVAGSQTLTIIIRAIALGHISRSNARWLYTREICVALINGMLWAVTAGILAALWFDDSTLGLVISMAMAINLLVAAIGGVAIPLTLKAMKIDPALAGGMAVTTLTDAVGFFSFLGLATLFYG
ncbi:MAG: magnesium transporter [Pseudomonadales bacterium]